MLIMGHPQFDTQDDAGTGHGIPPIPEWQPSPVISHEDFSLLSSLNVNGDLGDILIRLRRVFHGAQRTPLTSTRLHDLTCFVIHRLLLSNLDTTPESPPLPESIRHGIILYMFIMQGPTYFSHAVIFNQTLNRFTGRLKQLESVHHTHDPIDVWFLAVGMVAATGTPEYPWFINRARAAAALLYLNTWDDVSSRITSVLWLETEQSESIFRPHWDAVLNGGSHPEPQDSSVYVPPSGAAGFI
jgi:hypothetical protein